MAQGDLVALGVASTGWEQAGEQQGGVEGELQSPPAHKGQKKKNCTGKSGNWGLTKPVPEDLGSAGGCDGPRLKEKLVAGGCATTARGAEHSGQLVVLDAAFPGDEKRVVLGIVSSHLSLEALFPSLTSLEGIGSAISACKPPGHRRAGLNNTT